MGSEMGETGSWRDVGTIASPKNGFFLCVESDEVGSVIQAEVTQDEIEAPLVGVVEVEEVEGIRGLRRL